MSEENATQTNIVPANPEPVETPPEPVEEEEEVSIEEEFRGLYADTTKIKERYMRLAKTKEEEKDASAAQIIRLIAGDLLPLLSDVIAATGGAFDEVEGIISDAAETDEGGNITEEEVTQIYVTLLSNETAFKNLAEAAQDDAVKGNLQSLANLNSTTMGLLRENYGDDVANLATKQLQEASV